MFLSKSFLFQIDLWLSLEKLFLERKEQQFINIVAVNTFVRACQYILDISQGDPLFFNYSHEYARELLKLSRLQKGTAHVNCPIDPNLVTEGTFFKNKIEGRPLYHSVPEETPSEKAESRSKKELRKKTNLFIISCIYADRYRWEIPL
jgi:hypothetical protein